MKTRLTEMLGIKYPIVCGGIMRLAVPKLCAAISDAGALGNLTAAMYANKDELTAAIREVRQLTDKPFWVNITMLPAINIGDQQYMDYFDAIIEEKVTAVEIGGTPLDRFAGGEYLKKLKDAGVKVIHKLGSVKHALHAEKVGYDAVIAAGTEEGGHPLNENVATTVLTPRIVESIKIPVITAGGMANGRSLAAALCLGADGILMASRFICTPECNVHDNVRQELIRRQENETVLYGNTIGLQGRALLNDTMKKVLEIEERRGGLDEILPLIAGTLGPEIWEKGNVNAGSINVGQSIGLIHEVLSCKELIEGIVKEAEEIINQVKTKLEAS
ncbi:MAG: nitronate monooxygenase [Deltaproteobacteria bacterium]|nr:MAG: nitronate monooxygenase [Deltaproteobacteria bacterium]